MRTSFGLIIYLLRTYSSPSGVAPLRPPVSYVPRQCPPPPPGPAASLLPSSSPPLRPSPIPRAFSPGFSSPVAPTRASPGRSALVPSLSPPLSLAPSRAGALPRRLQPPPPPGSAFRRLFWRYLPVCGDSGDAAWGPQTHSPRRLRRPSFPSPRLAQARPRPKPPALLPSQVGRPVSSPCRPTACWQSRGQRMRPAGRAGRGEACLGQSQGR